MLKGRKVESSELSAVSLMREMHWTYEEYLSQPTWVIQTLILMINLENKKSKAQKYGK